jgi:hypothetical protein
MRLAPKIEVRCQKLEVRSKNRINKNSLRDFSRGYNNLKL